MIVAVHSATDRARLQRRTLFTLVGSVGPAGMGMAGGFAATTLASREIVANESLATLAATMISIAAANNLIGNPVIFRILKLSLKSVSTCLARH